MVGLGRGMRSGLGKIASERLPLGLKNALRSFCSGRTGEDARPHTSIVLHQLLAIFTV